MTTRTQMLTSTKHVGRMRAATSVMASFLLVGIASSTAQAQTIRSMEWHLAATHASEMWTESTGAGVVVAVLDTGVAQVPELDGQVLKGKNFSAKPGNERVDYGDHGTGIAATI